MRICLPVTANQGLNSELSAHFGSAPFFLMIDDDFETPTVVDNPNRIHAQGQCNPLAALDGKSVQAVITGGIGRGALMKLNAAGIRVYRGTAQSIEANLAEFKAGRLEELSLNETCAGHSHGPHGCGHNH